MAEFFTILAYINVFAVSFLLGEIIFWSIFDTRGGWKFRFSSVEDYPHLKPFARTYQVVAVIILLAVIIIPTLTAIAGGIFLKIFEDLGWYQFTSVGIVFPLIYIWTAKLIVGRNWNLYDLIPVSITLLTIGITFLINYLF